MNLTNYGPQIGTSTYSSTSINSSPKASSGVWDAEITKNVGIQPTSVFIGDANNDGQNDIVTANYVDNTVSILYWNVFLKVWDAEITKNVGNQPTSVFIGDANNDGQNDIITTNSLDDTISVFCWNTSSNDWDAEITKNVGNQPTSVFIGDANNDGQNDIVIANYLDNTISLLCGNVTSDPPSYWNAEITKNVGAAPSCVFIGDANNDGENDIITNSFSNKVSILCWNVITDNWDTEITKSVGSVPSCVFIGDANNDGENDIVTSNRDGNTISILCWNISSDDWDAEIPIFVGVHPMSVFIGDANNDGENDILTANYWDDTLSLLCWNVSANNWDAEITKNVGTAPNCVFIGDANNDGENDIVTSNEDDNSVSILCWNQISGHLALQMIENGIGSNRICIGDANNDGQNDILFSPYSITTVLNYIGIFCWNATSDNWNPQISKGVGPMPTDVFVGDANNDGQNDIVAGNGAFTSILCWNISSIDWDKRITKEISAYSVFVGDANNDGQNDIVGVTLTSNTVDILCWNTTTNNWDKKITKNVGDNPYTLFIGDANNDGQNEIVTANHDNKSISILVWNMTSKDWNPPITKNLNVAPFDIFIGDANNDGQNDIVVSSDDIFGSIYILCWNVTSRNWYTQKWQFRKNDNPRCVFIGDTDNDGQNEVVNANRMGPTISILSWNIISKDWNIDTRKTVEVRPFDVSVGDVNNDGQNDIVVAHESSSGEYISVFLWLDNPDESFPFLVTIILISIAITGIFGTGMIIRHRKISKKRAIPEGETKLPLLPTKKLKKPLSTVSSEHILSPEELEELEKIEGEVAVETEKYVCIVHRGEIDGFIYLCPHCNTRYCMKCAIILKEKGDKCWVCDNEIKL
ncbi:MAG: FG-GAP repeat domain-containing protein [Promethearchaeota archaeon]